MHILIIWFHYNQILEENDFYLWRYIPVHVLHVAASASFMNYSVPIWHDCIKAFMYRVVVEYVYLGLQIPWKNVA